MTKHFFKIAGMDPAEAASQIAKVLCSKNKAKGHRALADMRDTLTVRQVARILNRSEWAIYRAIKSGKIKVVELGDRKRTVSKREVERVAGSGLGRIK